MIVEPAEPKRPESSVEPLEHHESAALIGGNRVIGQIAPGIGHTDAGSNFVGIG